MSSAPPKLRELQAFFVTQTGLSPVSLGIVGNDKHIRGYHLGRDRIFGPAGEGGGDYSVKSARDRNAVSNAASALDIGFFRRLREMSAFIVAEARANAPDTRDLREIIFSPDGDVVLRWDRERGVASEPRPGEADNSHRSHTHVSWYRDSEERDKVALFARFFGAAVPAPGPTQPSPDQPAPGDQQPDEGAVDAGEIVKSFNVPSVPSICTVPKGTQLFATSELRDVAFNIDPARDMPFLGEPFDGVALVHRTDEQGNPTGRAFFARMTDLQGIRPSGGAGMAGVSGDAGLPGGAGGTDTPGAGGTDTPGAGGTDTPGAGGTDTPGGADAASVAGATGVEGVFIQEWDEG